jgi:hypothetical protein
MVQLILYGWKTRPPIDARDLNMSEYDEKVLGPYEQALEYALTHGASMADFDYAIEHRGAEQTLDDYYRGVYVGPWVDQETGESL